MQTKSRHTKSERERRYAPGSSRQRHNTTTLLLQLAAQVAEQGEQQEVADKERGQRIKARRDDLHLTQPAVVEKMEALAWKLPRSHALHPETAGEPGAPKAPVTLRGYQAYEKGGGIVWEKAKLLAKVLQMDVEVLLSGPPEPEPEPEPAPDPFAKQDQPVDVRLDAVEGALAEVLAAITSQLAAQTEVLNEIKTLLSKEQEVTADAREATRGLLDAVDVANRALLAGAPQSAESPELPAK